MSSEAMALLAALHPGTSDKARARPLQEQVRFRKSLRLIRVVFMEFSLMAGLTFLVFFN